MESEFNANNGLSQTFSKNMYNLKKSKEIENQILEIENEIPHS